MKSYDELYNDLTLEECVNNMMDTQARDEIIAQVTHRRWNDFVALVQYDPDITRLCWAVGMACSDLAASAIASSTDNQKWSTATLFGVGLIFGIAHAKLRNAEVDITRKQA